MTLAAGQGARINAWNMGSRISTEESSCTVTLQFFDTQGKLLKQSEVTLSPAKSGYLDVSRTELPGNPPRVQIRAVLIFGYSGEAPPGPDARIQFDCNIASTLELYDIATGKTGVVLTDSKPLPLPDPRKRQ